MDDITQTFLRAAMRLDDAAEALDEVIGETNAVQSKHDQALKRILDLIKKREHSWDATARSALSALGAKHAIQQRTLERQQAVLEKARVRYGRRKEAFELLYEKYADRMIDLRRAGRNQQKRESSLSRIVERMVSDLWQPAYRAREGTRFRPPATSHDFIALSASRLLDLLIHLDAQLTGDSDYALPKGRYRPVSFLEVGCGQGRVMLLASQSELVIWERLEGFDFNPDLVASGKEHLGLGDSIFVADALEFDYSQHDVIYSFRPFGDLEMQAQLEERMTRNMRDGAYLLAPFALDLDRYPELQRVDDEIEIWKKTG